MGEHVILVHGLWMRAFTLAALHRRLEREGYTVHFFDYASVLSEHDRSVEKLVELVHSIEAAPKPPQKIHFVCHSLGGLMTLRALRRLPGGSFFIGKNLDVLLEGFERWNGKRPVGAIAGRLPFGLGLVMGGLPLPHDGTVSVQETQLPGLTDHIVVPATHTGLLFSDEAAAQTVSFLRNKRFHHAAAA